MLAVTKPTSTRSPPPCSQWEKTWKQMHCSNGGGPSRPSPAISGVTARRSAPTCPANGHRGFAVRPSPTRSTSTAAYVAARFVDDPHLWASALFDEVVALGYRSSYVSFARQIRLAGLRPHCEACSGVKGRETIEIDHPAGEEIQWDWFERRNAPWGGTAYVLLGTLSHSGRTRGVLSESMDQAHLIEAMDAVMRRLGGTGPQVAHRPPGHGDRARHRRCAGQLRPGGQALWGHRHPVSAETREPQRGGRVRREVLLRALVAHHDGHHHRPRPS